MNRRLYRSVPLIALVALLLGGFLIIQPWGGEEAAGEPSEYSLCNVSVSAIPADVEVAPYPLPVQTGGPGETGVKIYLLIFVPLPLNERLIIDPETGKATPVVSRVAIDAETGEVVFEHYRTVADEARLEAVLATLRVGPPDPSDPAWPRTDTQPKADKVDLVAAGDALGTLRYRPPDPGSGFLVSVLHGGGPYAQHLVARTCASEVRIDEETGDIVKMDVVADEMPVFQRFLHEIEHKRTNPDGVFTEVNPSVD